MFYRSAFLFYGYQIGRRLVGFYPYSPSKHIRSYYSFLEEEYSEESIDSNQKIKRWRF